MDDPRGYALKLCDQFSKDKIIHKDWGGLWNNSSRL